MPQGQLLKHQRPLLIFFISLLIAQYFQISPFEINTKSKVRMTGSSLVIAPWAGVDFMSAIKNPYFEVRSAFKQVHVRIVSKYISDK
jgi:hypothetical protein